MLILEKYSKEIQELKDGVSKELTAISQTDKNLDFSSTIADLDKQLQNSERNNKIRIVFAGQYSAGKSSIIKMLTGNDDIAIDACITTDKVQSYDWNGIEIMDTPGIHTSLRPDHDEISYKAIASADMLIFVITNELFDDHIAEHFRKLAIDSGKANEMILVVNKMDRTTNGNTEEQQNIIREALLPVLKPYTPDNLYLSFISAESYLDSIEEIDDPEYAEELKAQSGYEAFVHTLNRFVREKQTSSKVTTHVYIIRDAIEKAIEMIQGCSNRSQNQTEVQSILQNRHELIEKKTQLSRDVNGLFLSAVNKIRDIGKNVANTIQDKDPNGNDLEDLLQNNVNSVHNTINECLAEARLQIDRQLNEIGLKFDDNIDEELPDYFAALSNYQTSSENGKKHSIRKLLGNITDFVRSKNVKDLGATLKESFKTISQNHKNIEASTGILSSFIQIFTSSKNAKLASVGKFATTVNKAVPYINIFASIFGCIDSVMQKADEKSLDKDKKKRETIRVFRNAFQQLASDLTEYSRIYISHHISSPIDALIQIEDNKIQQFRESDSNRNENIRKLAQWTKACTDLIHEIHRYNEESVNSDSDSINI